MLLKAVMLAEAAFVPPFATGRMPVTPVVSGKPVTLVITPDAGVPSAGVTKVGELASTTFPDPVDAVVHAIAVPLVAVQKSGLVNVPKLTGDVTPMETHEVPLQNCMVCVVEL